MERIETREMMSALADGQLQGEAFARSVEAAAGDPVAREAWGTYHLIGDVLRSNDLARGTPAAEFLSTFRARLEQEDRAAAAPNLPVPLVVVRRQQAANDGAFRWKVVAGVASLAAAGAFGWMAVGGGSREGAQLAAGAPGTVLAGTERGTMIRDARLDELLAAHRQLGGASVLQSPGFLRNATFDGQSR